MSVNRATRRLAMQALFQLDVHAGQNVAAILAGLRDENSSDLNAADIADAFALAQGAWGARAACDAATAALAPTWPAHRQAAVDRAILRLAHFDMTAGPGARKPKVVMNDAIEIAKEFSTEKSPGFINGLLDKIYRALPSTDTAAAPSHPAESAAPVIVSPGTSAALTDGAADPA
ncbi:transcription antitermination factor NusB [soil metagenome]